MKEDLHHLIDGELPDDESAELLHLLSVDPEKRALFRQQLKLQSVLNRNDTHNPMSASEESEMLNRLHRSLNLTEESERHWWGKRTIAMLALGIALGGGAGYIAHDLAGTRQQLEQASSPPVSGKLQPTDSDRSRQQQISSPAPNPSQEAHRSDTLQQNSAALHEDTSASLRSSAEVPLHATHHLAAKIAKRSNRSTSSKVRPETSAAGGDLSGAPEARELAKARHKSRSRR
jgi:hypothetical protein